MPFMLVAVANMHTDIAGVPNTRNHHSIPKICNNQDSKYED